MSLRSYLFLLALGLLVTAMVAGLQAAPGYMDADYYVYSGVRLASGQGFSEEILWNYLDQPGELPHLSHAYWLPLPSLLAALGLRLFPALASFTAARIPFLLLSAAVAPLSALLAYQLSERKELGWLAGGLALFSGFYLPYQVTVETFAPGLVLGALFFNILLRPSTKWMSLALGLICGLIYLTRAEGLLWLLTGFSVIMFTSPFAHSHKDKWEKAAYFITGAALAVGPWLLRNLSVFGTLTAPGAGRTLWLTSYDELFSYPVGLLTPERWVGSGWGAILSDRLAALGQNLSSTLVVQGFVVLLPLMLLAAWRLRKRRVVKAAAVLWLGLLALMSILFPYSGARGGFFHAGALLQPLLWALAAIGLSDTLQWAEEQRNWNSGQAWRVFASTALMLVLTLSLFVIQRRVAGEDLSDPIWDDYYQHYAAIEQALTASGARPGERVLVNNPPGYALAAGRSALVIPNGPLAASLAVAEDFGVKYLILESNHPASLDALYQSRQAGDLDLLFELDDTLVYHIVADD